MLLLLVGALALSLFWFLIGHGFLLLAGFDAIHDGDTVEWEALTGAFVLAAAAQAVHFALPLPSGISAAVLGVLFAVFCVVRRRDVSWLIDRVKGAMRSRPRLVFAFMCIAVVIALSAARPCKVEDTANYHAQVLRWADAARLVPGLALVHGRLAFNSLWFPLEAITSLAFLSNGPLPLVNTTTFLIGALYLFRQIVAGGVSRLAAGLGLGAFLPYITAGFFFAGSLSPDLPALTYGLLAFFAVARALESRTAVLSALAVSAHGHEIGIRVFASGLRTQNPTEAVSYPLSQWFPVWIRNLNNTARVCLSFLAVGAALLFASVLNPATRRWLAESNRRALFAITTVALLSSAFWFFEAPDVRFGASYLSGAGCDLLPSVAVADGSHSVSALSDRCQRRGHRSRRPRGRKYSVGQSGSTMVFG
jgi:hypothetical protein